MGKKYKHTEENLKINMVNEPAIKYGIEPENTFSPPLTEEELADSITSDEFWESTLEYIDKLLTKK